MVESKVGFLFNAASSLLKAEKSQSISLLRSYYLMRCKDLTKGYGLPEKHFATKIRCTHCLIEWKNGTKTRVRAVKLSKNQRRRINSLKINNNNNQKYVQSRKDLLHSKEVEQICSFCKKNTITTMKKIQKFEENITINNNKSHKKAPSKAPKTSSTKTKIQVTQPHQKKKTEVNVYSAFKDVYSLTKKTNTLASAVKEETKVIKNNKKKKDKFAGLCQKAVLATAKIKEANKKQDKLSLFLKPSTN